MFFGSGSSFINHFIEHTYVRNAYTGAPVSLFGLVSVLHTKYLNSDKKWPISLNSVDGERKVLCGN